MSEEKISKTKVSDSYPPEKGCYLRGNDYSPVAVVVILNRDREETPQDLEDLVRTAVESGAALAGTLQTENIGMEKVICNVTANPNVRYILLCGPESPGHLTGKSLIALINNGVDEKKKIIGTKAPTPYLYNIPLEYIERFRKQISLINCLNNGTPELVRKVVYCCYQEKPVKFREYTLYDTGAYPEPALSGKITWRITNPAYEPKNEEEKKQVEKMKSLMAEIKKKTEEKRKHSED